MKSALILLFIFLTLGAYSQAQDTSPETELLYIPSEDSNYFTNGSDEYVFTETSFQNLQDELARLDAIIKSRQQRLSEMQSQAYSSADIAEFKKMIELMQGRHSLIAKVTGRIELILFVKSLIPTLVQSYVTNPSSNHGSNPQNLISNIAEKILEAAMPYANHPFDLPEKSLMFRVSQKNSFKVQGVETDRLAINTGKTIIFNLKLLSELSQFELPDALQILLHEISHNIKDIPIESKDQWIADLKSYFKSTFNSFQETDGTEYGFLLIPKNIPPTVDSALQKNPNPDPDLTEIFKKNYNSRWNKSDAWLNYLKRHFIFYSIEKNGDQSRLNKQEAFYNSVITLDGVRTGPMSWGFPSSMNIQGFQWANIKSAQIKKISPHQFQILFDQTLLYLKTDGRQHPLPLRLNVAGLGDISPQLPYTRHKLQFNTQTQIYDLQRELNTEESSDSTMKLYRKVSTQEGSYISLQVSDENLSLSAAKESSLYLKSTSNPDERYVLNPLSVKAIKPGLYKMHFKAPRDKFEIAYLYSDNKSELGFFTEKRIHPSLPIELDFSYTKNPSNVDSDLKFQKVAVESVTVIEKSNDSEKVKMRVRLNQPLDVRSVTLEMENYIRPMAKKIEITNVQPYAGVDYNVDTIFLDDTLIPSRHKSPRVKQIDPLTLEVEVPEKTFDQFQESPRTNVEVRVNRFHTYRATVSDKFATAKDLNYRKVSGLIFHLEDGSTVRRPVSQKTEFSLNPKPKTQTSDKNADKASGHKSCSSMYN